MIRYTDEIWNINKTVDTVDLYKLPCVFPPSFGSSICVFQMRQH